jgi:muconolactone delta-isomerase
MKQFMVDIDLPEFPDDDFMALVPHQKSHINELMTQGVVITYSLAADRSKLWTTVAAKSEEEVGEILSGFPMIDYFVYSVHDLTFHDSINFNVPPIHLN